MNKLNKIISLLLVILFLNSCSGASDAGKVLRNEKITNTDEFFVKKRQPLNLPPDWKNVPEPGSLSNSKNKKKDIDRILKIEAINKVIGTQTKELKFLNPTLTKETFPDNYIALFPKGVGEKFKLFKDSIYYYQDSVINKPKKLIANHLIPKDGEPYIYTVRSGDVLGLIATRNNVRISQIQEWNGLSGTKIKIGQNI